MAAYTKTITVSVRVFGPEPTEKWASAATSSQGLIWGTNYWAYGTVGLPVVFYKGISNSISPTNTVGKNIYKLYGNSIDSTSVVGKNISHYYSNSVENTSAIGKNISRYYTNSVANTSSVGKNIFKVIYDTVATDSLISHDIIRWLANTVYTSTEPLVYKYRTGYSVTYGGKVEVGTWPRPTSLASSSDPTTNWTAATVSSTTWSTT